MSRKSKKELPDIEKHRENYKQFIFEMDDALDALQSFAKSTGNPKVLPLDYSLDSIDRLEHLLDLVVAGQASPGTNQDTFNTRLMRYMGETLTRNGLGVWTLNEDPDSVNYGIPGIGQIPKTHRSYIWSPLPPVEAYWNSRKKGLLKDALMVNVK